MTEKTPEQIKIEELEHYLLKLKEKRLELLTGAQSYTIGSRSLSRYNIELKDLNTEIKKTEYELNLLKNNQKEVTLKQIVFHDFWF